jgi:hypothetical protein
MLGKNARSMNTTMNVKGTRVYSASSLQYEPLAKVKSNCVLKRVDL